jgi:energy-coupling factor transport system permease protein
MLGNISLGTYYPGNSLLHRLQARTKLLALFGIALWMLVAVRQRWHFTSFIAALLLLGLGTLLSGISLREMWRRVRFLVFLIIIGSLTTPFARGSDPRALYTIGPLATSYGSAQSVLLICWAVLFVCLVASLLPVTAMGWFKRRRGLFIVLLLAALVGFLLVYGPPPAQRFNIGPLIVTYGGVWLLVSVSVALFSLFAFSLLLTMTTSPVALVEGLKMLLSPLRRLKLPVDDFALMALLALRFIPSLLEEVEHLVKAQMARGADPGHGTIRERLQSMAMLFVPLIRSVLRRAAELATALEARGYDIEGQQTPLHESSLGRRDYIALGFVIAVVAGTLLL